MPNITGNHEAGQDMHWLGTASSDDNLGTAPPWKVLYDSEADAKKAMEDWVDTRTKTHGYERYRLDTSEHPLTIGSRGMDQQYDEVMVAQFNKLGKPYGVKAEKVPISGVAGGDQLQVLRSGDVRDLADGDPPPYVFDADDETKGYYIDTDLGPEMFEDLEMSDPHGIIPVITKVYKTENGAQAALDKLVKKLAAAEGTATEEVWRFPIPDKMREDLMTRGLPLMALAPVGMDEDASFEDRAKALGLSVLAGVVLKGGFGKGRLPAMQRMLDDLAKQPANISKAAKKAGLTGTVEENALALYKRNQSGYSVAGMARAMKDAGIPLPEKTVAQREAASAYVKEMLKRAGANEAEPAWYLKDPKVVKAMMEEAGGVPESPLAKPSLPDPHIPYAVNSKIPDYPGRELSDKLSPIKDVELAKLLPQERHDESTVKSMMEAMQRDEPLPAIVIEAGTDDAFDIIDGHNRLEAARRLGFTHVPVRIKTPQDK